MPASFSTMRSPLRTLAACALGAWLVTVAPGCSGAPDPGTEEIDDDIPLDKLSSTLSTPVLKSARTYRAFGTEGGGFGQAGHLLKYFLDVRNGGKTTYFVNANYKVGGKVPDYAIYHFAFAQRQLAIPDDAAAFNEHTYYSDDKRYIAGSIQTYTLGSSTEPTYAIQFYPDDVIHEEGILAAVRILVPQIRIKGAKLAFVATGPQQTVNRVAGELRALGVEPLTVDQVLGSVKYLPLNPGEAWGYLRIFPKDQGALRPTDIPVFEELPLDLSVVAGTVTRSYQDVTSHVNLKSKERGTPNMVLRDASPSHESLAPYADKPVHLVVEKTGYRIEATTPELVESKLRERTDKPWIVLPTTSVPFLTSFDAMCFGLSPTCIDDGGRFGGKATNLGFLAHAQVLGRFVTPGTVSRKIGYDLVPYGFGVPVQRYRDFVAYNPELAKKLDAFITREKSGNLSANERIQATLDVKAEFYRSRVPPTHLAEIEREIADLARRFPKMDELKVRSSANAEDIPNFDGAGLHDSFSVKLSNVDNPDFSCALETSSDVVTKLKMIPKTPQCAIKGVYASLWNARAVEERSFARLDHATSAMGLAVVPAYDSESDVVANGVVITRVVNGADINGYTVTLQQGNNLVTNPSPGSIAQLSIVTFSADFTRPDRYTVTRYATPEAGAAPLVEPVLSDAKMAEVVAVARAVEQSYCQVSYPYANGKCAYVHMSSAKASALDMEFKVLANGRVVLKQVREFHGR